MSRTAPVVKPFVMMKKIAYATSSAVLTRPTGRPVRRDQMGPHLDL